MGKASSSKKVARAAGLGGSRAYGTATPWGYYFAVAALVLLGIVGVFNSREFLDAKINKGGNVPPTVNMATPWFEGYAVDACGKLLPPIKTTKDPYGITTKTAGIIYIDPKVKSAAGTNATLGKFANSVGMTLNAGEVELPGGHLYVDGQSCEGKPGHVYVMTWSNPSAPQSDGILQNKKDTKQGSGYEDTCNPDCDSGVLLENDQLVTIAFLPAPAKHKTLSVLQPGPAVIAKITNLISTGGTTTTSAPTLPSTSTTVSGATSTTVKGATTTTLKGATTTTPTGSSSTVASTATTGAPKKTTTTT